jgi:SAM-dependent methyltransferase
MGKNRKLRLTAATADPHVLYENSVQGVESQLDMLERIFHKKRGRPMRTFREDFCGSAQLSVAWVGRSPEHRAWGVDIDEDTLDWCRAHHLSRLGEAATRVTLVHEDVCTATLPPVDVCCAFNFSFNIFKQRSRLLAYFRAVRNGLHDDGLFFIDEFGGPTSHTNVVEKRKVKDGATPDGRPLETYTYVWEQKKYNPITHDVICHIHFHFQDGTRIRKAFTYPWRLWTLPELTDLLIEAGFQDTGIYLQGWDDRSNEPDGRFRRRTTLDDWDSWYGYIAALK